MRPLSLVSLVLLLAVLGLAALAPVAGAANPPEGSWAWSWPFVPNDGPHAFRAIAAGAGFHLYTAGDDWSGQWVVKCVDCAADSEGYPEWTDVRTEADGAEVSLLATDKVKNLYAAGTDTTTGGDIHLVKYLPDGTVKWQKSWDGSAHLADQPQAIWVTGAGTVFVAGTTGKPAGYDDAVLLKYDASGRLKWKYIVSTSLYDAFSSVSVDGKGNAYVTGQRSGTVGSSTMTTIKVNPYGRMVWQRQISGLGIAYDGAFVKVKGSSVYVGGTLYKRDTWAVAAKYTTAGTRVWARADVGPVDTVDDIALDAAGRLIFVGTRDTGPYGTAFSSAWVGIVPGDGVGTDLSGSFVNDMGGVAYPVFFHDVALDADGAIYLAGEWRTNWATEGNALVARIPAPTAATIDLQMEKIWRFDGPASGIDQFRAMLVQPGNGIFAAGTEHAGDLSWKGVVHRLAP
jgi:hypothetical protein